MHCSECGAEKVEYVGFNRREGDPGNPWDCINPSCGKMTPEQAKKILSHPDLEKPLRDLEAWLPTTPPTSFYGVNRVNPYGSTATKSTFTLEGPHAKDLTVQEERKLSAEATRRLTQAGKPHGHYNLYVGSPTSLICDALGTAVTDIVYRVPAADYLIGRDYL